MNTKLKKTALIKKPHGRIITLSPEEIKDIRDDVIELQKEKISRLEEENENLRKNVGGFDARMGRIIKF